MYNPLAKDQIGANLFAAATGYHASKRSHTPGGVVNIALWWRAWYKNMTLSFAMLVILFVFSFSSDNLWRQWLFPTQVVLTVLVFGITYVSLIRASDFRQRFAYRVFAPIARPFPNVARFWWYCLLFAPFWFFQLVNCLTHVPKVYPGPWGQP